MKTTAKLITSAHNISFWQQIACNALRVLKGVIKMNGEQAAAWEIVTALVCGSN